MYLQYPSLGPEHLIWRFNEVSRFLGEFSSPTVNEKNLDICKRRRRRRRKEEQQQQQEEEEEEEEQQQQQEQEEQAEGEEKKKKKEQEKKINLKCCLPF